MSNNSLKAWILVNTHNYIQQYFQWVQKRTSEVISTISDFELLFYVYWQGLDLTIFSINLGNQHFSKTLGEAASCPMNCNIAYLKDFCRIQALNHNNLNVLWSTYHNSVYCINNWQKRMDPSKKYSNAKRRLRKMMKDLQYRSMNNLKSGLRKSRKKHSFKQKPKVCRLRETISHLNMFNAQKPKKSN